MYAHNRGLLAHSQTQAQGPGVRWHESFCLTQGSFFQRRQRSLNWLSSHKLLPGRKRRIHDFFFVSHQVTWLNCSNTINNCNFNIHDHTNICIWKQMNILIITEPEKSEWWLALQRPWCVFHSQITRFFPSSKIRIACLVPCLHKYVN